MMNRTSSCASGGFSIIEAMVALLILAFGALAFVGWHSSLASNGDTARQRTEATRLAEAKIEELRGFERLTPAMGRLSYGDLHSGDDVPALRANTEYRRSWQVSGDEASPLRTIDVSVSWSDRQGTVREVRLQSVVSRSDPADIGALALPPVGNDPAWRPLGRHRAVPPQAVRLHGTNEGRSVLPWAGPSGGFLVFDDATGEVFAQCASQPADGTDIASTCSIAVVHLLQGFVSGGGSIEGIGIAFDRLQHIASRPECSIEAAVDSAGHLESGTVRYRCLMRPTDDDGDVRTPPAWSGRSLIAGAAEGATVCRYTPNATTTVNVEHPETYTRVAMSLDHQNFAIVAAGACPGGTVPHQGTLAS